MNSSRGYPNLPDSPGVYLFRDANKSILYIGKATSLKKRVSSYFGRPHDARIQLMVEKIAQIETQVTSSALEALLLEAELIKKYQPTYNIIAKDDKTYAYIAITDEPIPQVTVTRPTTRERAKIKYLYGPYTSTQTARTALAIIRRIFPFHAQALSPRPFGHRSVRGPAGGGEERAGVRGRLCFDATIGLCSGVCGGKQPISDYRKMLARLRLFLEGKRKHVIVSLKRAMSQVSRKQHYEQAAILRDQLFALNHIRDVALLKKENFDDAPRTAGSYHIPHRIEAYDISHISGSDAVGSMVVFTNGKMDSTEYRQFRIKGPRGPDDTRMLQEVLERRLNHREWPLPDLFLIDGGSAQLHAAQQALRKRRLVIPVAALAKGPKRKRADLYTADPAAKLVPLPLLIHVRQEAHRFAIRYHRHLKRKRFIHFR